jgi:hypothetical protein
MFFLSIPEIDQRSGCDGWSGGEQEIVTILEGKLEQSPGPDRVRIG